MEKEKEGKPILKDVNHIHIFTELNLKNKKISPGIGGIMNSLNIYFSFMEFFLYNL